MRTDVRTWLRSNGHAETAKKIDAIVARWAAQGKRTRRNWWDVLAGDGRGRPRKVDGVEFPVLAVSRQRAGAAARPGGGRKRTGRMASPRAAATSAAASHGYGEGDIFREPRPFLKWAGGKRQLLPEILKRLPKGVGCFHEPFLGGGAVFFGLRPGRAVLSDRNERLIRCYRGVKESVEDVIAILKTYRNEKRFFLRMRQRQIDAGSDAEVAAWMIFLNKTGYNGLYRVNSKNQFNVPFGDNRGKQIFDELNLRACSRALADADLRCEDFARVLDRARPGDAAYFDPPYVPLSGTSHFTSYTSSGFGMDDQRRLRDVALSLKQRGVFVLISNSAAPAVHELYEGFERVPVQAARTVNSNPAGRGKITELLML